MDVTCVVGMSKKEAQNFAEMNNLIFRLMTIDNEKYLESPVDQRDDRLCVDIEKGRVTRALIH
jgi:hypothetical protein